MIAHVIHQVAKALPRELIAAATSTGLSDDPLARYLEGLGISVFRGPLENVFARFQLCLEKYPCEWFFRVCADSPRLDEELLKTALTYQARKGLDLVTNIQIRTFPRGHSVEMVRASTFAKISEKRLTEDEKEHVTKIYYHHPEEFRIFNIASDPAGQPMESYAVDTVDDLQRLEKMMAKEDLGLRNVTRPEHA